MSVKYTVLSFKRIEITYGVTLIFTSNTFVHIKVQYNFEIAYLLKCRQFVSFN